MADVNYIEDSLSNLRPWPRLSDVQLCKDLIEQCLNVVAKKTALQINIQQCLFLSKKLLDTRETLQILERELELELVESEGQPAIPDSLPAAKELFQVLKRADALFKDCVSTDKWMEATLKQAGDWKETFGRIVYDLQWCRSLLLHILLISLGSNTRPFDPACCDGNLDAMDSFNLSTAAKQDQETLEGLLKDLKADHNCDGRSCDEKDASTQCLASEMLKKLQFQALPAARKKQYLDALSDVDKSNLRKIPSVLMVNTKDLPRGDVIGHGAVGFIEETIWRGELYAKKICPSHLLSLKQEIAVLSGLNHPNIMRLICCAEDKRSCVYVMELMDKSLHDLTLDINYKPPTYTQGVDLMLQVAEGIKYLHNMGIAHRDVKSLNVLIKFEETISGSHIPSYIARVADFGLSKAKNESTRYSHQTKDVGTNKWMAPEVIHLEAGEEAPTRFHPMKTDVYSFGIVCSEIISWQPPFPKVDYPTGKFKAAVKAGMRPRLPPDCPKRLAMLVSRCWDPTPLLRPNFREICTELRYIKGLLLQGDHSMLETRCPRLVPYEALEIAQGPWGGQGGSPFSDGRATSITSITLQYDHVLKPVIYQITAHYEYNGFNFSSTHGSFNRNRKTVEIMLEDPDEYFTQVEGHWGLTDWVTIDGKVNTHGPTSLTFHTNRNTYGPYGMESGTKFKSDVGRIIGFWGRSGNILDQLGVFILLNEE